MPELEGATYRRVYDNTGAYCVTFDGFKFRFGLKIASVKQDEERGQTDSEYFWSEGIQQQSTQSNDYTVLRWVDLDITPPGQMLPRSGFETRSELAPSSRDPQCFEKIRAWIQECKTRHPDYETSPRSNQEDADAWPRRLVDTGPLDAEPSLRLVEDVAKV